MHAYCPQIMSINDSRRTKANAAPSGCDGCFNRPSVPQNNCNSSSTQWTSPDLMTGFMDSELQQFNFLIMTFCQAQVQLFFYLLLGFHLFALCALAPQAHLLRKHFKISTVSLLIIIRRKQRIVRYVILALVDCNDILVAEDFLGFLAHRADVAARQQRCLHHQVSTGTMVLLDSDEYSVHICGMLHV